MRRAGLVAEGGAWCGAGLGAVGGAWGRAGLVAVGGVALGGGACTEMGHPAKARTAPFQVRPACSTGLPQMLRALFVFKSISHVITHYFMQF